MPIGPVVPTANPLQTNQADIFKPQPGFVEHLDVVSARP